MNIERNQKRRVYFSDMQRNWSALQTEAAGDLIDGMARHGNDADPLGEPKAETLKAA